ncbi:MAG TPA: SAVMC3_10250 family protein [Actinophytocola sp.]|jgi:hypothetical protein|nr:SAVMC3_10250 family protein [Actinophytocola sp.]
MRELLYLSERKLAAFHPEPRRRRPGLRGELGMPGVAKVGADLPAAQVERPGLDEVLAYLTGTPGKLRWYTEDDLPPGQWVQFEVRLGSVTLYEPSVRAVLFTDLGGDEPGTLLLHGSPEHLTGEVHVPSQRVRGASRATFVRQLLGELMHADGGAELEPHRPGYYAVGMDQLSRYLRRNVEPRATTWLGGVARVTLDTADLGIVVASPLFVEFVSAPAGTPPTSPS